MPPEQDPVIVEVTAGSYRYISLPYQRTRTVLSLSGDRRERPDVGVEESFMCRRSAIKCRSTTYATGITGSRTRRPDECANTCLAPVNLAGGLTSAPTPPTRNSIMGLTPEQITLLEKPFALNEHDYTPQGEPISKVCAASSSASGRPSYQMGPQVSLRG